MNAARDPHLVSDQEGSMIAASSTARLCDEGRQFPTKGGLYGVSGTQRIDGINSARTNFWSRQLVKRDVSSLERSKDDLAVLSIGGPRDSFGFCAQAKNYLSSSTLHGLKYIGDGTISLGERLFWLASFLSAVSFAAYFITNLYDRYNLSPVIMSVNPNLVHLSRIPFPAITICNMNQARKSEAESILQSGSDIERMLLDDFCNINNPNNYSNSEGTAVWYNVQKFMIRVAQSCPEMIRLCLWKEDEQDCQFIFNNALTDEGLCCTFNQLPRHFIFKNPRELNDLNLTFPSNVEDWNPENGFPSNMPSNSTPWRATGAGTRLGFTIVLDADVNSYYCSSTNSIGFKILLHTPVDTPKMADFAFFLPPGMESRIVIVPKINDATASLRSISIEKRMCFFTQERPLIFYRSYTQRNCELECQANFTLDMCKCVPYYLPKSKSQKICGKKEQECIDDARKQMDTSLEDSCFEINYQSTITYAKLSKELQIKDNIRRNESTTYFIENMAVVHFYFVESQFSRSTKSEIYGFSEFLSNTGGLLGLFMGFSFLSAVEVMYYLSLRVFCNFLKFRNKKKPKINIVSDAPVYPFAK